MEGRDSRPGTSLTCHWAVNVPSRCPKGPIVGVLQELLPVGLLGITNGICELIARIAELLVRGMLLVMLEPV